MQRILGVVMAWPRNARKAILIALDCCAILISVWAAFALRLGSWWPVWMTLDIWLLPLMVVTTIPAFLAFGFYRSILRYVSGQIFYDVLRGVLVGMLAALAVWELAQGPIVPRSAWLIYWMVAVLLIGGIRMLVRSFVSIPRRAYAQGERIAIYGAGAGGAQLALALHHTHEFHPLAFLDDDPDLHGSEIHGVKIYDPRRLEDLIPRLRIVSVLLAIPSASRRRRREIVASLEALPVRVLAMPGLPELAAGLKRLDEVREVDVEDILGRDPVKPEVQLLALVITGKSVMVTGGGGSIGSELCRQIVLQKPSRLVIFELAEYALYRIERELQALVARLGLEVELVPVLGSVDDFARVRAIMQAHEVATVYHAAAYKHVPIVERNPFEGVRNNILGTLRTAQAAIEANVSTFVLVSTDKAVRPTNVMGATKRFAELVLQGLSQVQSRTLFSIVRFGNVLASSGSVVPLFREQIRHGGPITVTDPEIVRYFMTITEAAQLVIQAGAMTKGGDVFVLDMGEPIKIVDLARHMIHLSGFEVIDAEHPDGDIEIRFIGLRPGEKLYEELLLSPSDEPTEHPRILRAREAALPQQVMEQHCEHLEALTARRDRAALRRFLVATVQGYQPYEGDCDVAQSVPDSAAYSAAPHALGGAAE